MGKIKILFLAAFALFGVQPAYAATSCNGAILSAHVSSDGSVLIRGSWRSDYTQICNISSIWKGIPLEVCALWAAKADAAIATGHSVTIYYSADFACTAIPSYGTSPAPTYLMLNSTGV